MQKKQEEERLKIDLSLITKEIVSSIPHVTNIFLCGSYGRDEGAWVKEETGTILPYNDYDLFVITNENVCGSDIQELRKRISNMLGIQWIDINIFSILDFQKKRNTVKYCDFYYASKLVYGDDNIFKVIYKPSIKKIGKSDSFQLYFTRLWPFFGIPFKDILTKEESRFIRYQLSKSILAAIDAILIKNSDYSCSYVEKVDKFVKKYAKSDSDKELARFSINNKLSPNDELLSYKDFNDLFFSVYDFYLRSFKRALGIFSFLVRNPKLTYIYFLSPKYFFARIKKNRRIKSKIDMNIAQNYLFCAIGEGMEKSKFFYKALKIYNKYNNIDTSVNEWGEVCNLIANWRNS